jgi:hypothetical protein
VPARVIVVADVATSLLILENVLAIALGRLYGTGTGLYAR